MKVSLSDINIWISIISGITTILGFIFGFFKKRNSEVAVTGDLGRGVIAKKNISVIFVLVLIITSFISGFFLSKVEIYRPKVFEITFNYPIEQITNNGWLISEPSDEKLKPLRKSIDDGIYGKLLSIKTFTSETCFDYNFEPSAFLYKRIKFVVHPTNSGVLYVNVKLRSKKLNLYKDNFWLKIFSGQSAPQKVADDEWIVFIEPEEEENNWLTYTIDIPKQIQNTFGTLGWVYVGVKGVRLRGSLEIAKIIASTE